MLPTIERRSASGRAHRTGCRGSDDSPHPLRVVITRAAATWLAAPPATARLLRTVSCDTPNARAVPPADRADLVGGVRGRAAAAGGAVHPPPARSRRCERRPADRIAGAGARASQTLVADAVVGGGVAQ